MNKLYALLVVAGMVCGGGANAQIIGDIKNASLKSSGGDGAHDAVWILADLFLEVAISGVVQWQRYTLEQRYNNPSVVSVEVMLQGAAQPSAYYILNPRVRANWGLFSTDFRQNYLLEESFDGVQYLRTDEWQVLQLNLISTDYAILRMGGGIIHEAFNDRNTYSEFTTALTLFSKNQQWGGMAEFRTAEPRHEVGAQVHYKLMERGAFQAYATAGVVYQRYYSQVSVWGMQGGLMMRIH